MVYPGAEYGKHVVMNSGSRIVAIETGELENQHMPEALELVEEAPADLAEDWWEEPKPSPSRPWALIGASALTTAVVLGWSALFAASNWAAMKTGGTLQQWTGWLQDWSVPVLLVAVLWLIGLRNSRREAKRFGETAKLLSEESARLETRLTTVNRELSLAREFVAAQSRDIESLGRVATERLSQHADKLASLIVDNGSRLDAIKTVSAAALENMESLRSHLPVIASSAKDVSNNIANAGRAAHSQVGDLIAGFNKLNQFGQASERQVAALREVIDKTIAEWAQQTDQLQSITESRLTTLIERGSEFRSQLDSHEVEALASIQTRAKALSEELTSSRQVLDAQEGESLASLRSRLSAMRDESAAIARSVREGEGAALEAWQSAIGRLEEGLAIAITKVREIDEKAMASAQMRLTELSDEAEAIDERMAARDQIFAEELKKRQSAFEIRHGEFIAQLGSQLADLDGQIGARREAQEEQGRKLLAQSESVTVQLEHLTSKLGDVATLGEDAEGRIAASLGALGEKLTASRDALAGTDSAIAGLTDGSVRLLELIQASVQHSTKDLPQAMGVSEAKLGEIEGRVAALKGGLSEAEASGKAVADYLATGSSGLTAALHEIEALSARINEDGSKQTTILEAMAASLASVRSESLSVAELAQGELKKAIDDLNQAAHDSVAGIGTMSASAVAELAARIGDESSTAIDKAMRARVMAIAEELDQAAAQAIGVSRDAAVALRAQLAKVSELTGHLEQRVAHARARAEEQVDNDFARRVALITESLNSNAIDIASAIDTEVTDTAWASYLKGDRGIFTRRAVRLLDVGEAKSVAQLYEDDTAFRDHVSRYIHDFEAMLRQLLSTRDGHALGVTLLSSDMGKLYVALAQGIERLRN